MAFLCYVYAHYMYTYYMYNVYVPTAKLVSMFFLLLYQICLIQMCILRCQTYHAQYKNFRKRKDFYNYKIRIKYTFLYIIFVHMYQTISHFSFLFILTKYFKRARNTTGNHFSFPLYSFNYLVSGSFFNTNGFVNRTLHLMAVSRLHSWKCFTFNSKKLANINAQSEDYHKSCPSI